jgi:hypothetical protein
VGVVLSSLEKLFILLDDVLFQLFQFVQAHVAPFAIELHKDISREITIQSALIAQLVERVTSTY